MLFLTVYGPELESLFYYIHKYTQQEGSISREQLYSVYLPQTALTHQGTNKKYRRCDKLSESYKADRRRQSIFLYAAQL